MRHLFCLALLWVVSTGATTEGEEMARVLIISSTVLGAFLVGVWLYQLSQRSSRTQFQGGTAPTAQRGAPTATSPTVLMPTILAELNKLQAPAHERQRVASRVSDLVEQTMTERVDAVKRELDERYDQAIEERRRTEAVLQQKYTEVLKENKQTASVLGSIAEGLVVVNNRGEVVMMNPAAERLLAVTQKDRIGKPLLDDLKDEQLISLVKGSGDENREIVLNAKQDSTKRVLRASNAVITDEDGKAVGMVAVLSDVTKQRELDQLKSEFLSKVSHELRTPLVAMQHALSILAEGIAGPLGAEQHNFVDLTQRNLQRLNALINDLLDLAKLEAKKTELRVQPASLSEVIGAVCDSLEAWAKSKVITIVRRLPGDLPAVLCDSAKVTQVLTNLIGNAIKFTPQQGRITVEVKLVPDAQEVEVSVTDTGVGIATEDLPKLFNKFQQVGERSATDITGTGLGLAIAKEIVDLHQGRLWAESDPAKKGARFAFTLPLRSPSASAASG